MGWYAFFFEPIVLVVPVVTIVCFAKDDGSKVPVGCLERFSWKAGKAR